METIISILIVGGCFGLFAIGIWAGKLLKRGCGSLPGDMEDGATCGLCAKQEAGICENDEGGELVKISKLGYPKK